MFEVTTEPVGVGVGGGGGGAVVVPTVSASAVLVVAPLLSHAFTTTLCLPVLIVRFVFRLLDET